MAEVLFVSKPVTPPWNDSSKNLVRDIAGNLQRHSPLLMGRWSHLAILGRLMLGPSPDIWHFFFAPNARTSTAARLARAARRVPSVHTVCSLPPEGAAAGKHLFADVTVTLSEAGYARFRDDGVDDAALRLIPPCVPALPEPSEAERAALREKHGVPQSAAVWIYPGDLEFGGGAEVALDGFAAWNRADALLLMACREKTPQAADERARLVDWARQLGIDAQLRWLGETPAIHELLALSDFVVMVNRSAYAKMDYPLVVLESMCLGRPVLVAKGTPSDELARARAAVAIEAKGEALAEAVERLAADEAARRELGRRARALATSTFSPEVVTEAYERLYEELRA